MTLNQFTCSTVLNIDVADKRKFVVIENDQFNHLGNAIVMWEGVSGATVQVLTLGDICTMNDTKNITFLKMNIEGAEKVAPIGMNNIIKRTRYICISFHDFKFRETGNVFYASRKLCRSPYPAMGSRLLSALTGIEKYRARSMQ